MFLTFLNSQIGKKSRIEEVEIFSSKTTTHKGVKIKGFTN
jgi:hypothetical protein